MSGTFIIDRRDELQLLSMYRAPAVAKVLQRSALAGAVAMREVVKAGAPEGRGQREGQYYRRMGLGHGTFRETIRAAKIRRRGMQLRTVGYVVGPMGPKAFIRAWREYGTKPHGWHSHGGEHPGSVATHWLAKRTPEAMAAAQAGSERVLLAYVGSRRAI